MTLGEFSIFEIHDKIRTPGEKFLNDNSGLHARAGRADTHMRPAAKGHVAADFPSHITGFRCVSIFVFVPIGRGV